MSSALRARTRSAGTTGGKSRLIATSETPTAPVGKGATSRLTIHKRGGNSAGVVASRSVPGHRALVAVGAHSPSALAVSTSRHPASVQPAPAAANAVASTASDRLAYRPPVSPSRNNTVIGADNGRVRPAAGEWRSTATAGGLTAASGAGHAREAGAGQAGALNTWRVPRDRPGWAR